MPVPLPLPQTGPSDSESRLEGQQQTPSQQSPMISIDCEAASASGPDLLDTSGTNPRLSLHCPNPSHEANESPPELYSPAQNETSIVGEQPRSMTSAAGQIRDSSHVHQQQGQEISGGHRRQMPPAREGTALDPAQEGAATQLQQSASASSPIPDHASQGSRQTLQESGSNPIPAVTPSKPSAAPPIPISTSSGPRSISKPLQGTASSSLKSSVQKPSTSSSAPAYRIPPAMISSVSTSTKTRASGTQAPPLPPPKKHVLVSHPYLFGNNPDDRAAALRSLGGKAAVSKLFGPGNVRPPPSLNLVIRPRNTAGADIATNVVGAIGSSSTANGPVTPGVQTLPKAKTAAAGADQGFDSSDRQRPSLWSTRKDITVGQEHTRILFKVLAPKPTGRKRKRGTEDEFTFVGDDTSGGSRARTQPERMRKAMRDNLGRVHVQALATISDVHSFSNLPDFRYDAEETHGMVHTVRKKLNGGYDTFEKGGYLFGHSDVAKRGDVLDEGPAMGFIQGAVPYAWGFKQNPRAKVRDAELDSLKS